MGRARRGSVANAVLVALLFLVGMAVALMFERQPDATAAGAPAQAAEPPHISAVLGTGRVLNEMGQSVDIATKGEPAIVMISSVSCSWCKRALGDLRELSAGRPLPRLKLLTLEGAADGAPMIQREQLRGVQLIGPENNSARVRLTFRYQGTPTFLAIDREGRVVQVMPGYPMREVLKLWYTVMVGDAEAP